MVSNRDEKPAAGMNEFIARLREQTGPMHERLEGSALSKKLMDESVSISDYGRYLAAMYRLTDFTENHVFPRVDGIFADINNRRKLHFIERDLNALAIPLPANVNGYTKTELLSEAECAGWAYVAEGSTLGGRVILKFLGKKLDIANATAFLEGYGEQTGSNWKNFIGQLSGFVERAGSYRWCCKGF